MAAGLLGLCSCASTPTGVQRELALYQVATNGFAQTHAVVPYLPAPANSLLEGVLAIAGAGLALWASHLHRSISDLQNGKSKPPAANPPGAGPAA